MDKETLGEDIIAPGRRLIEALLEQGVPISAACWLKEDDDYQWFLYVITPLVDNDGATKEAYTAIVHALRRIRDSFGIHALDIKAVGEESELARAIRELHQQKTSSRGFRLGSRRFGGLSIEGAYVYPPLSAPLTKGR